MDHLVLHYNKVLLVKEVQNIKNHPKKKEKLKKKILKMERLIWKIKI